MDSIGVYTFCCKFCYKCINLYTFIQIYKLVTWIFIQLYKYIKTYIYTNIQTNLLYEFLYIYTNIQKYTFKQIYKNIHLYSYKQRYTCCILPLISPLRSRRKSRWLTLQKCMPQSEEIVEAHFCLHKFISSDSVACHYSNNRHFSDCFLALIKSDCLVCNRLVLIKSPKCTVLLYILYI